MATHSHSLHPISDEALAMIASWFRVLAEPSRLRILRALEEGEKTITDLVVATGTTQANVSRHVQSLAEAGMVGRRKEGLLTICFIADPTITELC
ncbi:MAG TPA: metalloregulator ArsR/SmtB family transcription factor, partial [Verrucomicrobiales bacterium]|nr:metalloregulator ArsR/SmtB family transcription factor [Verrucomicrobiales bacterium]